MTWEDWPHLDLGPDIAVPQDDSDPEPDIKTGEDFVRRWVEAARLFMRNGSLPADFLLPVEIRPGRFYWGQWDKIPWEAVDDMSWCVAENPDLFGALVAWRDQLQHQF
jgi:hypothetical protein